MGPQDLRRHVRKVIERHGVYVQGVVGTGAELTYVYSIGFQRLHPPRPELVVLGLPVQDGACLVNRVFEAARRGRVTLEAGAVLRNFTATGPQFAIRMDMVLPHWVDAYAGGVGMLRKRRASAMPCLQLVLPDHHGRWPQAPDADPLMRQQQPLLGRDDPWLEPVTHAGDPFADHAGGDTTVAALATESDRAAPRWELLSGWALERDRVAVGQVPWLADQVAYGDIVEVGPPDGSGGVPPTVPAVRRVVERRGYKTMCYEFHLCGPDAAVDGVLLAALYATLDVLGAGGETRVSSTPTTLHVNSRDPDGVRHALRPFERDGLLAERHGRCNGGCSFALRG